MKYLKLFETSNDYEVFKNSDEYITPHVIVCKDTDEVNYQEFIPPSIFPLYLTVNRTWEEESSWGRNMYWEIDLPDEKLYNELNNAFILYEYNTQIMVLPDGWLDEHPIYVDGHKIINITKESGTIYFQIENDYPYYEIINSVLVSGWYIFMDGQLKIKACCEGVFG